jgi:hypothetical protein
MDRSVGAWTSYRGYLFGSKRVRGDYITLFDITKTDDKSYSIAWSGQTEGVMDVVVDGNELKRSRTYFDEDNADTYQVMEWIDEDTIVFRTSYDGTNYREEIRFLGDNIRLRQNVGTDVMTGDVTLVGQYFEERRKDDA